MSGMPGLTESVRALINGLADDDWAFVARKLQDSPTSVAAMKAVLAEYGRTLVFAPDDLEEYLDVIETGDGTLDVRAPLWTAEEGRSDLELRLTASELITDIWKLRVDDILVA